MHDKAALIDVGADPRALRAAFGRFPSGVAAVCTAFDGVPKGLAASSFTTVSLDPPLVSVCIQNSSTTWPVLRDGRRLGVSVLAHHHEATCLTLASKAGDRFAEVQWFSDRSDAVFIEDAALHMSCSIHAEVPAGDHIIVLLRIHQLGAPGDIDPLVFHGSSFRRLVPTG